MAVERVDYGDSLRQGTDKINAVLDHVDQQAAAAVSTANDAKQIANDAKDTAEQALDNSEATQHQLDTIVIDGDSSVEAAQARVSTPKDKTFTVLKDRLDEAEQDLITHKAESALKTYTSLSQIGLSSSDFEGLTTQEDFAEKIIFALPDDSLLQLGIFSNNNPLPNGDNFLPETVGTNSKNGLLVVRKVRSDRTVFEYSFSTSGLVGGAFNDVHRAVFALNNQPPNRRWSGWERLVTEISFSEDLLFNGTVSSGVVNLSGSVNDYRYLAIITGVVAEGAVRTEITRGWLGDGFRINSDHINVSTNSGKFVAKVIANNQLEILQADDQLRQIYGLKIPW